VRLSDLGRAEKEPWRAMACSVRRCVTWRSIGEKILHRAAGSRGALLLASLDGRPAIAVDRLASGFRRIGCQDSIDPLTDRAGQRRTRRVGDAAVLTEHDVLTDLDRDTAHRAAEEIQPSQRSPFVTKPVTGVPTLATSVNP
jgi:hypothetical protein